MSNHLTSLRAKLLAESALAQAVDGDAALPDVAGSRVSARTYHCSQRTAIKIMTAGCWMSEVFQEYETCHVKRPWFASGAGWIRFSNAAKGVQKAHNSFWSHSRVVDVFLL